MSTASYLLCNILGKQTDPNWKPDPVTVAMIAETLAAAEERGRRMGVEERDGEDLYELLGRARDWLEFMAAHPGEGDAKNLIAIIDAALAPRDSGKAPKKHKCMRCGEEFACTAPGCVALYDVLPTMIRGGIVVEHGCKSRYPRQANNQSPSQNE